MTQTSMKDRIREMLSKPTHKPSGFNLDGSPVLTPGPALVTELGTITERYLRAKGLIEGEKSVTKSVTGRHRGRHRAHQRPSQAVTESVTGGVTESVTESPLEGLPVAPSRHERVISPPGRYPCRECDYVGPTGHALRQHRYREHRRS